MYTKDYLMQYEYFFNLFKTESIDYALDSLTGVINKNQFFNLIDYLIQDNAPPFSLGLIDLDNYHFIMDNFGIEVAEDILCIFSESLSKFVGDNGLVGRYGDDKFLFIYFDIEDYDKLHDMLDDLYKKVLRKTITTYGISILVTGTTGIASYPKDAKTTRELLELTNKTLYRGKMKGRNCYIIYVESKHKDIKIQPLVSGDIFKVLYSLKEFYLEHKQSLFEAINNIGSYLKINLNIPIMLYVDKNGNVYNADINNKFGKISLDFKVNEFGIYEINSYDEFRENQALFDVLGSLDIKSLILLKNKTNPELGCLIFADKKNKLWNPDEKAVLFYITELLS